MATHSRNVLHHARDLIGRDPDTFTRNVFTRLFTIDPDLHELFPRGDAQRARGLLPHVIDHVLEMVPADSGHDELVDLLAQLARSPQVWCATEHYDLMYRA